MTPQELAEKIGTLEYPVRIPDSIAKEAKANRLVIIYGASDDLMEFEGAIYDEIGAYEGTKVKIYPQGLQVDVETAMAERDIEKLREYFKHENEGVEIEALWNEGDWSWCYETTIPHATFDVMEDGEPYCRGIVISLDNLGR